MYVISSLHAKKNDTTYIYSLEHNLSIRTFISQKNISLAYYSPNNEFEYNYTPNNTPKIGIGADWRCFSFSLSYGFDFIYSPDKNQTKSFDLQIHQYGKNYTFDIICLNYKGFYLKDIANQTQTFRPDIDVTKYAIFTQYVFNSKKFSYNASFNQNAWQKKSAGSLLIGSGFYYGKIKSNSPFAIEDTTSARQIYNFQLGPNIGYAYTLIIKKRFFTTVSVTAGGNIVRSTNNTISDTKTFIYPTAFIRASMGHKGEKWGLNLTFTSNNMYTSGSMKNLETGITSSDIRLSFVRRFHFAPKLKPVFLHNFIYNKL